MRGQPGVSYMFVVYASPALARRVVSALVVIAVVCFVQPAHAAIINYGNFVAVPVTFGNVSESKRTNSSPRPFTRPGRFTCVTVPAT